MKPLWLRRRATVRRRYRGGDQAHPVTVIALAREAGRVFGLQLVRAAEAIKAAQQR